MYDVNGTYYPSTTVPPITTALPPPTSIPVTVTTLSTTTAGVTTTTLRVTTFENDLLDEVEVEEGCCTPLAVRTAWWRHQMKIFSGLLVLCAGNSPVTGDFPSQRPVTRSFDVFFDPAPEQTVDQTVETYRFVLIHYLSRGSKYMH